MASVPSSVQSEAFAKELDKKSVVWVEEIGNWIAPHPTDGTYYVVDPHDIRSSLAEAMKSDTGGFTEGKLKGTLAMVNMFQKKRRKRLNDTHLAFRDGKLDCSTFEFVPTPPPWEDEKTYEKGDAVTYKNVIFSAKKANTQTNPVTGREIWGERERTKNLALISVPLTYRQAMDSTDSDCPRWIEFLSQIFVEEDTVTPSMELLDIISLMCGYVLMPHLKANRIFMLAGPTAANGKSTFLKIIDSILPEDSVAHQRFRQFASATGANWSKAELPGKRLVICNEESSKDVDASILKDMSDGMAKITAERKFMQPFEFYPTFKIICSFNTPPLFDRVDQGILRRFVFIPCLAQFTGKRHADDIIALILTERTQILAWMVRQAARLHSLNWMFPKGGELISNAKEEYLLEQNSVLDFCKGRYEPLPLTDSGKGIPVHDIYDEYFEFVKKSGRKPFSRVNFGQIAHAGILGKSYSTNGKRYRKCKKIAETAEPVF